MKNKLNEIEKVFLWRKEKEKCSSKIIWLVVYEDSHIATYDEDAEYIGKEWDIIPFKNRIVMPIDFVEDLKIDPVFKNKVKFIHV